jgi:signal transduction histidine kinase
VRKLRARLLLLVAAALVLTAAAAWLLFARFTRHDAERFVVAEAREQAVRFAPGLAAHHRAQGSWAGVDSTLERIAAASGRVPALVLPGGDVRLAPSAGARDLAASALPGGGVHLRWSGPDGTRVEFRLFGGIRLLEDGRPIGAFHLLPPPLRPGGGPAPARFVGAVTRSAAVALGLAVVAALAAALWLARGVVGPLEELTRAVRTFDAGDLDARVAVRGADEIGALAGAFNQMAERLSRVERLRRAMVADVAHELRTPLTNLRAQLEAMQDGLARADGPALASLHEEILHLARLVDDLELLAAADAGRLAVEPQPLAIRDALERALAAVAPRAARGGVTLEIDAAPLDVRADARRLGQVLRNLLDNALAHTPAGGRITLGATRPPGAPGTIEVTVADSGEGIPAAHLPHVFERFRRVDPSRTRETGGSGLGLAIVQQLVTLMGGAVTAESTPGRGTTIRFTLPAVTDS